MLLAKSLTSYRVGNTRHEGNAVNVTENVITVK